VVGEYIERREGAYFIAGSRVSLDSVVHGFLNGDSPESIRDNFPTLALEQVYGAITFYLRHRDEVDTYLGAGRQEFEQGRRSQTHLSSELRTRLAQARDRIARRL
jgi:uncharacterized protein (DUF433 family)